MPTRTSKTGSELFIIDNSDTEWKVRKYLHDWCQLSSQIDIATGYFEIARPRESVPIRHDEVQMAARSPSILASLSVVYRCTHQARWGA